MSSRDFDIERSWSAEPLFYRAPHPEQMTPDPYQHAAVEYAISRDHALIGDVPGLGKTIEGTLVSNAIEAEATLVLCPASLTLNWEREVWRWSTIPNVETYPILKASDGVSSTAHYVILSYAMLRNPDIHKAILDLRWDHVIADEAHALKDHKGNLTTKRFFGWMDKGTYRPGVLDVAGRFTPMTGTPMPNQPMEIYNLARATNWDAIDRMSTDAFRNHYYEKGGAMIRGPVYDEDKGAYISKLHWSDEVRNIPTNLKELQYKLRSGLMVRRLKEQVLKQLPPKQWHPFPLSITPEIRKVMKLDIWKAAERLYDLEPDEFNASVAIDGEVSTAKRLLGEAKAKPMCDYIEDLLDSGVHKIVVGAWHHTVMEIMHQRLSKYGLVYMDGSTSPKRKQQAVDQFQGHEKTRIILGQMLPLGEGWTLTEAQDVVLAEPFWVPGKNDQLIDRIHRRGQTGSRLIGHVPVVPDSLDERVMASVISKDRNIFQALDA